MFNSVFIISILSLLLGLILGYAAVKFRIKGDPLVDQIDAILPQTQCGQCNYPGCKPYAKAIAKNQAPINQCPPGGQEVINKLSELLDVEVLELNSENGETKEKHIVEIDENLCIGCTLCIQACPVDAFVGAAKVMTTVISSECTGCDLCIPVCPVDCIYIVDIKPTIYDYVPNILKTSNA